MTRWPMFLGSFIGFAVAILILGFRGAPSPAAVPSGPILSECAGRIRELVIHYEPAAKTITAAVYRGLLGRLGPDVTVDVVCPDAAAFEEFRAAVGTSCRIAPVITGHPITTWSRDRWVALAPPSPQHPITVCSPRGEAGEDLWPARAGDQRVGNDLARVLAPAVVSRRSRLYFDGGDFLADDQNVFVIPRVLSRNLQQTVGTREELLQRLRNEFKKRVILLDESPDHHAGMFMVSIGRRTMLVADPSLAERFWTDESKQNLDLPGGPDFSARTQHLFDAVAARCAGEGYQVARIPVVPSPDGRTYLTYVNVLLDREGEQPVVYMPVYRGAGALNAAAGATWERLGFEVRPVDCTDTFRHFGCLHCLVNVLSRS
jgi:hypothetical protein